MEGYLFCLACSIGICIMVFEEISICVERKLLTLQYIFQYIIIL